MDCFDSTTADRLILRSLIEEGLPARAKTERWPVTQPFEIAHLVFDPLLGGDYEKMIAEPIFKNFPAKKVNLALTAALGLMKCDRARIVELVEQCRAFRT